jgi:hypothetical protein
VSVPRLIAWSAVAMVLTHWLRLAPLGFQAPRSVRYEDFVDLLTPFVVLGPALAVLAHQRVGRRAWAAALLGSAMFVQGHGLHLSANSISYASGIDPPAYLWDEVVGHHLWFGGLTVVVVVVAESVRSSPLPVRPPSCLLACLVGITWGVNVVEGGTVPFGTALAAGLAVYGWRSRTGGTGNLLALAFGLSLVLVGAYGVWQGGYPQPSELGWL